MENNNSNTPLPLPPAEDMIQFFPIIQQEQRVNQRNTVSNRRPSGFSSGFGDSGLYPIYENNSDDATRNPVPGPSTEGRQPIIGDHSQLHRSGRPQAQLMTARIRERINNRINAVEHNNRYNISSVNNTLFRFNAPNNSNITNSNYVNNNNNVANNNNNYIYNNNYMNNRLASRLINGRKRRHDDDDPNDI